MISLIEGVTVTVVRPVPTGGVDSMGEPVEGTPEREAVGGVLFDPTAASDASGALRMAGAVVDADFHFPKSYTESLRGCSIEHAGHLYRVQGDARRYPPGSVPGPWNAVVSCREVL